MYSSLIVLFLFINAIRYFFFFLLLNVCSGSLCDFIGTCGDDVVDV